MTTDHHHPSVTDEIVDRATSEYRDALTDLHDLENEKKKIVGDYTQELEKQKIDQLRSSV